MRLHFTKMAHFSHMLNFSSKWREGRNNSQSDALISHPLRGWETRQVARMMAQCGSHPIWGPEITKTLRKKFAKSKRRHLKHYKAEIIAEDHKIYLSQNLTL